MALKLAVRRSSPLLRGSSNSPHKLIAGIVVAEIIFRSNRFLKNKFKHTLVVRKIPAIEYPSGQTVVLEKQDRSVSIPSGRKRQRSSWCLGKKAGTLRINLAPGRRIL
jgi:hypothetical protein